MTEHAIATTIMRGGTSKGLFVDADVLPAAGPGRDALILALLGSPDPMQIDGLGGSHSSTSKLMAVARSEADDCDVDYLFAQAAIDEPVVDYAGNCGNLTTAVAPFAIDEGLVPAGDRRPGDRRPGDRVVVRMRNLNTGIRVRAEVPVDDAGRAAVEGDLTIAGVPGTGPAITTDFLDPGGSVLGSVLPTGSCIDKITLGDGSTVEVSILDVTSPHAFVRDVDVDLDDLARLEEIRTACGAAVGLDSRAIPRLAILAPVADDDAEADLAGSATSMQRVHHAFPLSGALCTAAAALIPGTIAAEMTRPTVSGPTVRLRHPKGVIAVRAQVDRGPADGSPADGFRVRSVGVVRTARRLMRGEAYVVLP